MHIDVRGIKNARNYNMSLSSGDSLMSEARFESEKENVCILIYRMALLFLVLLVLVFFGHFYLLLTSLLGRVYLMLTAGGYSPRCFKH